MASVPNLPIAPAVPTPGAPGAPDADGAAVDLFAQLLGGGPLIAVVAGPGAAPADVVTLRAAPTDDEAESADGETAPDGATPADIIPLLQAQSGFPVAVVPAARPPGAPARPIASAGCAGTKPIAPASVTPIAPIPQAASAGAPGRCRRAAGDQARERRARPTAEIVGAASQGGGREDCRQAAGAG